MPAAGSRCERCLHSARITSGSEVRLSKVARRETVSFTHSTARVSVKLKVSRQSLSSRSTDHFDSHESRTTRASIRTRSSGLHSAVVFNSAACSRSSSVRRPAIGVLASPNTSDSIKIGSGFAAPISARKISAIADAATSESATASTPRRARWNCREGSIRSAFIATSSVQIAP